jgi:hypothetical protein
VRYIDAGYAVALGALALYALGLVARRHHLEAAVRTRRPSADGADPAPPS